MLLNGGYDWQSRVSCYRVVSETTVIEEGFVHQVDIVATAVTVVAGQTGEALDFSGAGIDIVDFGDIDAIDPGAGSFCISFLFQMADVADVEVLFAIPSVGSTATGGDCYTKGTSAL